MTKTPKTPLLMLTLAACAAPAPEAPEPPAPTLHTFTSDAAGFDTHSFWLDTGREVIVFDAQFTPALADQVIAEIRAATASPITTLVITHPNPDKFNGAAAFQAAGAEVVASRATAAAIPGVHAYKQYFFVTMSGMFTAETYPAEARVDRTFDGALTLADGAVELRELAHAGVSSTQTVAFVPAARALIVGDLVHHGAHAWLEGGIVDGAPRPDLAAWRAALDELRAYPADTIVYGGRGATAPLADAVEAQQDYLTRADAEVTAYLAELGPRATELDDPALAATHHTALQARLAAIYPDRALPYLVGYGVYGLVASHRARAASN